MTTNELIKRLRSAAADKISWNAPVIQAAADEIERLRAALESIKSADPEMDLGAFYIFAKETAKKALSSAEAA